MSRDSRPWLSVVMPTYNGAAYVGAALESVCREAADDIEVVVADDGSTDATLDVVQSYGARVALRVVSRERVGNWVVGTNTALRAANGRFACFLHQDDVWLPGRVAALRRELATFEGPLLVHASTFLDPGGAPLGAWRTPFRAGGTVASSAFVERLLVQNFLAIPAPVFDRASALDLGGLDESLWYTADWDFWLRLARLGPVRVLRERLTGFRVHPGSQTMARDRTRRAFEEQLSAALERHLEAWARDVPPRRARSVRRAAEFSIQVNSALAAAYRGERLDVAGLARSFVALGPAGWTRYLRDSRIFERVGARLQLRR